MGILEFLKKIFREEIEAKKEIVNLDSLKKIIQERKQEIGTNEKKHLKDIEELVSKLIEELKEEEDTLKKVDLTEKKEAEKVKLIVRENLNYFTHYLKNLIKDLESIKYDSLKDTKDSLNNTFSKFEKVSLKSFQKATFLIGNELKSVTNSITNFFKTFKSIVEGNKNLIEDSKILKTVEEQLKQMDRLESEEAKNIEDIKIHDEKLRKAEKEILSIRETIKEIKESESYRELVEKKKKLEEKGSELESEISNLKSLIDFKALAGIYHSTENKMNLLKEYREHFKESFKKYPEEKFLDLVDIKDIDKKKVKGKINKINSIKESIKNIEIGEDETKNLENEIDKVKFKVIDIENGKKRHEKLNAKIKENRSVLIDKIKKEAEKLNIILE